MWYTKAIECLSQFSCYSSILGVSSTFGRGYHFIHSSIIYESIH